MNANNKRNSPTIAILIASVGLGVLWTQPVQAQCAALPAGALSWWKGEGDALDFVNANDGMLLNGTGFAPGMVGQAFDFDGVSAVVEVPGTGLAPAMALTVEAWINLDNPNAYGGIAAKGINAFTALDYYLGINNGYVRPHLNIGGTWQFFNCNTFLLPNTWYHVAMTYDGSAVRGYVNGVLDGEQPGSGAIQSTTHSLRIGAYTTTTIHFAGLIDEVTIYDRALSGNELFAIHAAGAAGKCGEPTSIPPDNAIDARQPTNLGGAGATGWDAIELTMNLDVSLLMTSDFALSEQGGDGIAPSVASLTVVDADSVLLTFTTIIEVGTWTTITYLLDGTDVRLGFLPADVNADTLSDTTDVQALIESLDGVTTRPIWSTDIDRSGVPSAADVLRELDLLNGAGDYPVFLGASLP